MPDSERRNVSITEEPSDQKIKLGKWPDPEDVFFFELGEEIFKRNIPFLNEILKQLVTMSIALSGGSLMFLDKSVCDPTLKLAASVMFFVALISSFVGVLPYRDSVRRSDPDAIKENVKKATEWKNGFVWAASIFIGLGLILAFFGVLLNKPTN